MNPQGAGVFKCLLPDVEIARIRGITHEVSSSVVAPTRTSKFFGSAKAAEVSL
jgi:hypothetical protein